MISLAFVSTAHVHFPGFAQAVAAGDIAARIAAIWDDDEDRGRRHAARFETAFEPALDALVARGDIDGFVVCAPNNQRLDLLRPLFAAGKPIMCEKPLALSAAEAVAIHDLAKGHDAVLTTGFFRQAYGVYRAARDALRRGAIGRVTHAQFRNAHDGAYRRRFDDADVAWTADPAVAGGGGLLDMGAHALHLLAWFFGPAEQVWATMANRSGIYPAVDDHGIIHVRLRNGVFATAEAGWITVDEPGALEVFGDAGSLRAADLPDGTVSRCDKAKQRHAMTVPADGPRGVQRLLAACRGVLSPEERAAELAAAVNAAAMMEAAYKANAAGTWQPVAEVGT